MAYVGFVGHGNGQACGREYSFMETRGEALTRSKAKEQARRLLRRVKRTSLRGLGSERSDSMNKVQQGPSS
jgi:hypothetical protein